VNVLSSAPRNTKGVKDAVLPRTYRARLKISAKPVLTTANWAKAS
jgi:hypothetical protein